MKKIISVLCISFISGMLFTAFSPSMDGRAVVADKGEMPSGMFGKTVGYLPGDSVSVTNPANGKTVDILVLGSLDPSEGVAILLSPEAAQELGIEKNSNNLVRLARRTGKLDESVYGTAVIAQGPAGENTEKNTAGTTASAGAQPDKSAAAEEPAATVVPAAAVAPVTAAEPVTEQPAITEKTENAVVPAAPETDEEPVKEPVVPASAAVQPDKSAAAEEPAATVVPVTAAEPVKEPVVPASAAVQPDKSAAVEEPAATVVPAAAVAPVTAAEPVTEQPAITEKTENAVVPAAPVTDEEPVKEPVVPASAAVQPDKSTAAEEPAATVVPAAITSSTEKGTDSTVASAGVVEEKAPAVEVPPDSRSASVSTPVTDSSSAAGSSEEITGKKESAEPYAPIILVPAKPKVPVDTEKNTEISALEETAKKDGHTVEKSGETAESAHEKKIPADMQKYVCPNLKELDPGKYYVQIAVLNNEDNIRNILASYGKNYPLVLVPLSTGTAYQVMIGPLGQDEYGTILARFKSKGFKDAFLRKIR